MSQTYLIEIDEGLCYFCKKTYKNIGHYTFVSDDTINICKDCYCDKKINSIEKKKKINDVQNYYTKYKIVWKSYIHYVTIHEFRNIGFQDYNKLIK